MPKKDKQDFDEFLLESIDENLTAVEETIKASIYLHLAEEFGIKTYEIPQGPAGFSDAPEFIFGLGASHLEILIINKTKAGGEESVEKSDKNPCC